MTLHGQLGPARWYFTSRAGGVSLAPYDTFNLATHVGDDPAAVAENRRRLSVVVGAKLVAMAPVHGTGVAFIAEPTTAPVADVDALVTNVRGIGLLAFAADCVPVVLIDPAAHVVASVHAGWPGVRDGVVLAAIDAMSDHGATASSTTAFLGPAICGACYPVPQERFDAVVAKVPHAAATSPSGEVSLDLRQGLQHQLEDLGLRVEVHGGCVAEDRAWFSYRRDGRTGRQGAVVVLD